MKDSQSSVPLLSEEALQCAGRSRECKLTSGVHLVARTMKVKKTQRKQDNVVACFSA